MVEADDGDGPGGRGGGLFRHFAERLFVTTGALTEEDSRPTRRAARAHLAGDTKRQAPAATRCGHTRSSSSRARGRAWPRRRGGSTPSARTDLSESTAWKDDNDQSNCASFKARLAQYQQVVITFSRPVSVNEIYNAAMVSGATGSTELVVQLGPQPTDDRTFTVMGTGKRPDAPARRVPDGGVAADGAAGHRRDLSPRLRPQPDVRRRELLVAGADRAHRL